MSWNSPDLLETLYMRRGDGALINILQSATPLQQGRRRASQKNDGGLCELCILQCGHGIGDPGPCRDRCDPRGARQPGDCIGGKHRCSLAPRVYDADAARLRAGENRRDMPAA